MLVVKYRIHDNIITITCYFDNLYIIGVAREDSKGNSKKQVDTQTFRTQNLRAI